MQIEIPASLTNTSVRTTDVLWDTTSPTVVWHERRGKHGVLVAQEKGSSPQDITPAELSVKTGVGYGGGAFTVQDGTVYFCANNRIYRQSLNESQAYPITAPFGGIASPQVSPDGKWLVFVCHIDGLDGLAIVDTEGQYWQRKLFFASDFVTNPVWHPNSKQLACVTWNHPNMPWNGTELQLFTLSARIDGFPVITHQEVIAGDRNTAIFQPAFSPDGRYLAYVSDATGWGQIYGYDLQTQTHTQITIAAAEHGYPAWLQGMRMYDWNRDSSAIIYQRIEAAQYHLWEVDLASGAHQPIDCAKAFTELEQVSVSKLDDAIAVLGAAPSVPKQVVVIHDTDEIPSVQVNDINISQPQRITWLGHDGQAVHGIYTPPHPTSNPATPPPLLISIHSGPTRQTFITYDPELQFFTSLGLGVLQVNYRGSTGYGRAYMDALWGNLGIHDVEDAYTGALHLIENGQANPKQIIIEGSSSAGFTVLQSLITKPGFYCAGICAYPVSNQIALAEETHKFEAKYNDWLLGKLPAAAAIYRERSPMFHADKIVDPVLLFHGARDVVVPQAHTDAVVAELRKNGIPHAYHIYEDEGHGWRNPENITHYYQQILAFLQTHVFTQ